MTNETIQWFPGHMAKTHRLIAENLPAVDIVLELLDARAMISSQNPEIRKITGKFQRPVLTLMNKSDLSDGETNRKWLDYNQKNGRYALLTDCKSGTGINELSAKIKSVLSEKTERYKNRGMAGRRLRAMVVGIPNVGKSSLLNRICRNVKAKVEDRPGVTREKQWVSSEIGIDLLDMPGMLWPKFENGQIGQNLAFIGSVKDDVLDLADTAVKLCGVLAQKYPEALALRYRLDVSGLKAGADPYGIFSQIGKNRGLVAPGGEIDHERCAKTILTEFRGGKIGRISLEEPDGLGT